MHTTSLPAALLLRHLKPKLGVTALDRFQALFQSETTFLTFCAIFPFIKSREYIWEHLRMLQALKS